MSMELLLGNEAIALGLVEGGCRVATAYPGTPSSEILAGVVKYKNQLGKSVYTEWSTNEKVAFEVALAASWTGLRAAVAMKQVGLNVASDPLFSSAYTGVVGGFLVIPADDPGPHSSQTEQDSRLVALNAKVPVFDPSTPEEARLMVERAYALSEELRTPVMLRPTTRLCHALQSMEVSGDGGADPPASQARFRKDPIHWTATPKLRHRLHQELNEKLRRAEQAFETSDLNFVVNPDSQTRVGVIASGVAFHSAQQALLELGLELPLLKIGTPYPLPRKVVQTFMRDLDQVLVLEEPDACIELQIPDRRAVHGRLDGFVPGAGELSPETVSAILDRTLRQAGVPLQPADGNSALQSMVDSLQLPVRRPRLCPGCSHRSAFFSLKREFGPRAIYPGDIGCYTLGTNLRAVDTFVDMGAAVSMADGLYQAGRLAGEDRPIIATIGDSTFLHSGIPPLVNAVHTGSRFVLVILDNHTTAMTGFQPTAEAEVLADGGAAARALSIPDLVRACGVGFVRVTDPYDQESFREILRLAQAHVQDPQGGVAVVIADRPCVLYDPSPIQQDPVPVVVTDECDGCRYCLEAFECPALVLSPDGNRVDVDRTICIDCGQCIDACYKGFILPQVMAVQDLVT